MPHQEVAGESLWLDYLLTLYVLIVEVMKFDEFILKPIRKCLLQGHRQGLAWISRCSWHRHGQWGHGQWGFHCKESALHLLQKAPLFHVLDAILCAWMQIHWFLVTRHEEQINQFAHRGKPSPMKSFHECHMWAKCCGKGSIRSYF